MLFYGFAMKIKQAGFLLTHAFRTVCYEEQAGFLLTHVFRTMTIWEMMKSGCS